MKIVVGNPPNIDQLDAVFHCKDKPIFFAWGDTIYNPKNAYLWPSLMAHEAVHGMRQVGGEGGIEAWWTKYIEDQEFRYAEELAAHRVEYAVKASETNDRNARAKLLMFTAARLVAPLYGYSNKKLLQAQRDLQS